MTRDELLEKVKTTRAEWDALLSNIDPSEMTKTGVVGDWSIKDIIAHVLWSEREMIGVLKARALVGSDLWNLKQDDRNAAVFETNRRRSLDEILKENRALYQELLALFENVQDEELNDAKYFKDMPSDWMPWQVFRGSTWKHYAEHTVDIRKWLDSRKSPN